MLDKQDYDLTMKLMMEMGLEEGDRRRVVDQDTGRVIKLGSKEVVTPGSQSGKFAIEFDPIGNPRLMNAIFADFLQKLEAEEEIPECSGYSTYSTPDKKMEAKVVFRDGSTITSNQYMNESLCLTELVHRINDDQDITFFEFDRDRRKPATIQPQLRGTKRRAVKKDG